MIALAQHRRSTIAATLLALVIPAGASATASTASDTAAPLPRIMGGTDPHLPLIVIDAGHGGRDSGALSADGSLREKDVALRLALAIRDALLASHRARVVLTRSDDRFLPLRERYGVARRLKADLFLSIHLDTAVAGAASGATAYTGFEFPTDRTAAKMAARENRADIVGGVAPGTTGQDVSSILIDPTQRDTVNASAKFARAWVREAQPSIPLASPPYRLASFTVLAAPDLPSVLLSLGNIANPAEAAVIDSADGRARIGQSVAKAVSTWSAARPPAR